MTEKNTASTSELLKLDQEYVIHPHTAVGDQPTIIFDNGHGIYLEDTDGKVYIDGQSQLTCVNLGYGQKEIAEAVAQQMAKLEYSSIFFGSCTLASIQCSQKLAELTPKGVKRTIYTVGGSDSIDTAFRITRAYWRNKGKADKFKIISLYNSYHGASFGAVSATNLGAGMFSSGISPLLNGFIKIPNYYCYRCPFGMKYPDCGIQCAKFLAYTIMNEGKDTIAAFVAEPEQGSGGAIAPPPEYWPMVRKICADHEVLLIADEVMTGFGRTGKMFALEHWDVIPDIMTLAKGLTSSYLPLGAVVVSDTVADGLKGARIWGFTYSGHPVCCAAAIKTMEIYVRDKVVENAAEVGKYALDRLNREFMSLPCVDNVGGLGLMLSFEIVANKATKKAFPPEQNMSREVTTQARQNGLLVRGGQRIQFTPPLIITKKEVDKALDTGDTLRNHC